MRALLLACTAAAADCSPPRRYQAEPDGAARVSLDLQAFGAAFQAATVEPRQAG